jgi:sugar/nucleoside kinase (ribokinase family)
VAAVIGCLTRDSVISANGERILSACGGNALYAAAGAHVWEPRVGVVARVGTDYPAACLAELAESVDLAGLRHLPGEHPLRVTFAYRPDGERTRQIPAPLLDAMTDAERVAFVDTTRDDDGYLAATPAPEDIPAGWLAGSGGFHLPAILARSHRTLVAHLRTHRPDAPITLDAPWFAHRDWSTEAVPDLLGLVDAVLPSEDDVARYRPGAPLLDVARELVADGARVVVVKLGGMGSLVVDRSGRAVHVAAYPADVVDPTGAGDGFCGAFLVGLIETGDPVRAALYGTVAASFVVEARSALPVLGHARSDAEARLRRIEPGVRAIEREGEWRTT